MIDIFVRLLSPKSIDAVTGAIHDCPFPDPSTPPTSDAGLGLSAAEAESVSGGEMPQSDDLPYDKGDWTPPRPA